MEMQLTFGDVVLEGTLLENPTSRDFCSLLPLTLTLSDYEATEKVSDLPSHLSTVDAPDGINPDIGDITYYAPWGNLAIFYRDFDYASGLVKLGHIKSGTEILEDVSGEFTVIIEVTDEQTS
ncbi:cyclophilin-like fold protein [Halococcus sp. IIIV-5B]|uniref:cyclophilin-like fold protein n=1 Tax=Halococcus sp. IIIV-5B TaxID=2321230 RepID=UPI000E77051B|nr:cyclophilin-like fold protein [Halococcus sp. IIIV-5B]RJT07103.1 hypothetical protein D3261_03590 [Halococcus sp. IIIV-5B]